MSRIDHPRDFGVPPFTSVPSNIVPNIISDGASSGGAVGGQSPPPSLVAEASLLSPHAVPGPAVYPDIGPMMIHPVEMPGVPGFFCEPTGPICGSPRAVVVCPGGANHTAKIIGNSCKKPGCSVCWPSWAARAAHRAASVVRGYRTATGTPYHAQHVVFSPPLIPSGMLEADACRWTLKVGSKIMTDAGVKAAAVVVHPYRIRPEYREIVRLGALFSGQNRYRWCLDQPDPYLYLYLSPHLHALTYGVLSRSITVTETTGWIYRNLGARSGEDLEKTLYYLLSHAWVRGNRKAVRYWGGMSAKKLGCVVTQTPEWDICPECGEILRRVDVGADYQDVRNAPRAFTNIEERDYFVRSKKRQPKQMLLNLWEREV